MLLHPRIEDHPATLPQARAWMAHDAYSLQRGVGANLRSSKLVTRLEYVSCLICSRCLRRIHNARRKRYMRNCKNDGSAELRELDVQPDSSRRLRELYPSAEPRDTGRISVAGPRGCRGFSLYYEDFGPEDGLPAVFLHGGPGAGCSRRMSQLFNLSVYRVILFDQRGCGSSGLALKPGSSDASSGSIVREVLAGNNTWELVDDIEAIREHLGIKRWVVCGGSWGTTLALAYASKHAERVMHMVLRGVCLFREEEFDHIYGPQLTSFEGASARNILPTGTWEAWTCGLPQEARTSGVGVATAFLRGVTVGQETNLSHQIGARALLASWFMWEMMLMSAKRHVDPAEGRDTPRRLPPAAEFPRYADTEEVHYGVACDACGKRPIAGACYRCSECRNYDLCESCYVTREQYHPQHHFIQRPAPVSGVAAALSANGGAVRQALLEMHYVKNRGFLAERLPEGLLSAVPGFNFAGALIHGASDAVCPVENAKDLAERWSGAQLYITKGGHSQWDTLNVDAFVRATDAFAATASKQ